jgi:glycosyltransferase involved in cell wall biosynthesis
VTALASNVSPVAAPRAESATAPPPPPRLSVIIPTYNRSAVLAKCLDALLVQEVAPHRAGFEIVVADDGSSDDTGGVARSAAESADAAGRTRVRYLRQPNSGANAARNHAIAAAAGEILLFINDDVIPATPRFIAEHLAAHDQYPDDTVAVLGRVTLAPHLPASPLSRLHLDRAFDALAGRDEHDWRAFFTCNVSVKRSLLERGGVFDERVRYHEDLELSRRLAQHGLRVIYRPDALGYHDHLLTEAEFFSVAAREARALVAWSGFAPPAFVATLASLGFEPALPSHRRVVHRITDAILGPSLWRAAVRRAPQRLATPLYARLYRAAMRKALREELQRGNAR